MASKAARKRRPTGSTRCSARGSASARASFSAAAGRTAHEIFGSPDDLKLRSCMTLFDVVAPDEPAFRAVLDRFYGGEADPMTLAEVGRR